MNENEINVACNMHWRMSSAFKTLGWKTMEKNTLGRCRLGRRIILNWKQKKWDVRVLAVFTWFRVVFVKWKQIYILFWFFQGLWLHRYTYVMEKYQHMKAFIGCCLDYSKHRT